MALIFFDRAKDGFKTLLGSTMTREEMSRSIKLEEHVSIFDDYLKSGEAGDGTYGYMGDFVAGRRITVPKAMAGDSLTAAQRAARVRLRMSEGKAPLLISFDPKTGVKIFAEEDKEAFEDGYICENCIQYQAVPHAPKCNWLTNPNDGCGQQNY
jgi:hypothetical protein